MNISYVFLSVRNAKGVCRQVPLEARRIKHISVEPSKIKITRTDGREFLNSSPTPEETKFWGNYTPPVPQSQTRWDMALPDPLAIAALEEYDAPRLN